MIPQNTLTVGGEPYPELSDDPIVPPVEPYDSEIPLFYGHYWETGTPTRSSPYTACVDYSAVKGGSLVAYRWSGETELTDTNFVELSASECAT